MVMTAEKLDDEIELDCLFPPIVDVMIEPNMIFFCYLHLHLFILLQVKEQLI